MDSTSGNWRLEFAETAKRQLAKLDKTVQQRIWNFLKTRVAPNPRGLGTSLSGKELGNFWRYRVGDYRLIVEIFDDVLVVLVVKVGHRREIYR